MRSGSYSGTYLIQDNKSTSNTVVLSYSVASSSDISFSSPVHFGTLYYNQSGEKTFTITNRGTTVLSNLRINSTAAPEFKLEFSPAFISSLNPGDSREITAKLTSPSEAEEGETLAGNLVIASPDIRREIPGFFRVNIRSYLLLRKITVWVGSTSQAVTQGGVTISEKAEIGERIRVDMEVENTWKSQGKREIEIEDIEADLMITGLAQNQEDIEMESGPTSLSFEGAEREHTFTFEFSIPLDARDAIYDAEATVTGTDDRGNRYRIVRDFDLAVERRPHDISIQRFVLHPATLSCERSLLAEISIANLGRDDEDYVRYTLLSHALGIALEKSRFEISSETDDEEYLYEEAIPLTIRSVPAGRYPIELKVYRDFDVIEDVSASNLQVMDCNAQNGASPNRTEPNGIQLATGNQSRTDANLPMPDSVRGNGSNEQIGRVILPPSSNSIPYCFVSILTSLSWSLRYSTPLDSFTNAYTSPLFSMAYLAASLSAPSKISPPVSPERKASRSLTLTRPPPSAVASLSMSYSLSPIVIVCLPVFM